MDLLEMKRKAQSLEYTAISDIKFLENELDINTLNRERVVDGEESILDIYNKIFSMVQ